MTPTGIFVFGSNLAGRHGKGAAKAAHQRYGAIYGRGKGLQGRSYAIPTKDANLKVLPLEEIKKYVNEFLEFARVNPDHVFYVTPIGCGLAGYRPEQIGPMFRYRTTNVNLPEEFAPYVHRNH